MTSERATPTLCVECGPGTKVSEDGCCATCGATAVGPWAEVFAALLRELEAVEWGAARYSLTHRRDRSACPYCLRFQDAGHAPHCTLFAALQKARGA